jgi:hypothetical protein
MSTRSRLLQACIAAAFLLGSQTALADKVAVLPFLNGGNASQGDLDAARAATRTAVLANSDTLPTDSEMVTAEVSAKDGVADTSGEYRAAGRASGSDWTVAGHVEMHGSTYHLEIDACQVSSGRVESLAREIDPAQASAQILQMLVILLRPAGVADAVIPWEHASPTPPPTVPTPTPVALPPPAAPAAPASPAGPTPMDELYGAGHPLGLGLGIGALGALHRSPLAVGSSASAILEGTAAFALPPLPGLELRGNVGGSVAGPGSVFFDFGARDAFPIAPSLHLFFGPEVDLGGFFTTGGDRTGRFLLHGAGFLSLGLGGHVQVEAAGDLAYAAGGQTSLALGGGTLRVLARF